MLIFLTQRSSPNFSIRRSSTATRLCIHWPRCVSFASALLRAGELATTTGMWWTRPAGLRSISTVHCRGWTEPWLRCLHPMISHPRDHVLRNSELYSSWLMVSRQHYTRTLLTLDQRRQPSAIQRGHCEMSQYLRVPNSMNRFILTMEMLVGHWLWDCSGGQKLLNCIHLTALADWSADSTFLFKVHILIIISSALCCCTLKWRHYAGVRHPSSVRSSSIHKSVFIRNCQANDLRFFRFRQNRPNFESLKWYI